MRPNIFLGTCEDSTQYKKWYFEMMVDQVEPFVTAQASHLRVGWALTEGYSPYPGGGEGWGGNGVGDDLYSYGFDGLHLWSGELGRPHSQGWKEENQGGELLLMLLRGKSDVELAYPYLSMHASTANAERVE